MNSSLQLKTTIKAEFITNSSITQTKEEQKALAQLNMQADEVCESLQYALRTIIIEMLALKRETNTGESNEKP